MEVKPDICFNVEDIIPMIKAKQSETKLTLMGSDLVQPETFIYIEKINSIFVNPNATQGVQEKLYELCNKLKKDL